MEKLRSKLEQNLGWGLSLLLLAGCLIVVRPFVSPLLLAVVLSYSSWPIYQRLVKVCGNRRTLGAFLMTLAVILSVLVPFLIIGTTLADNVKEFTAAARRMMEEGPPAPPAWLARIPMVGQHATEYWQSLAQDTAKFWTESRRLIEPVSSWLLRLALGLGSGLLDLTLSVLIAFFLFRDGASVAARLTTTVDRIGGDRGKHLLTIAGNTVRGVVYGILGTALLQAVLAGIGFLIAGVPGVGLLVLLTFFCSVVPVLGTGIVSIPVALWLFHQGSTGWGIFMLVWGLGIGSLDNFVKPWLISQGSDMPFILIFFGVIGGALMFGFIGVFIGPTLLAVGARVVEEWTSVSNANSGEIATNPGVSQ